MQHWSWIWAAVASALQAQAQNLMHWTAFGFGLGIAAYFEVSRVPGRFDSSGRLQWITVRQAIGHRLWNSAELRDAKGHDAAGLKTP
ncbi:hypothetical protein [uncultured Planktomarina sp.]|uniref:hypothetical protein n=1 Tax=uncultured Planktomarina sp. TaxID=1538529 RepID=UPI003261BC8F